MKIVKEFIPKETPLEFGKSKFKWGLGNDGQLYYSSGYYFNKGSWFEYNIDCNRFSVSLSMMKEIVDQFNDLLVFL